MKVYGFLYNGMTEESSFATMSLHETRKGAEMAMEFHREEQRKEWLSFCPTKEEQEEFPFGNFKAWAVEEFDILNP